MGLPGCIRVVGQLFIAAVITLKFQLGPYACEHPNLGLYLSSAVYSSQSAVLLGVLNVPPLLDLLQLCLIKFFPHM